MSRYGKLILLIGAAIVCVVVAILPFAFASGADGTKMQMPSGTSVVSCKHKV